MQAAEQRTIDDSLVHFPTTKHRATAVLRRLRRIVDLPERPLVVDIGAAQGCFLVACDDLGYEAIGIEPFADAREVAVRVAEQLGKRTTILDGTAESIPLPSASCDIVHANSVIEHVNDAQVAFFEAARILKPGGVFWFSTASSLCPSQHEIAGFPAFSWYPNALKQRIMRWAAEERPELVGHTLTPALHWFTPWKARRMLREAGFSRVYDRWDLRLADEGGPVYAAALKVIKMNALTKFAADVLVADCAYAAVR